MRGGPRRELWKGFGTRFLDFSISTAFLEEALSLAGHFSPYSSVFGQMISTKSREVVSFVATATHYIPFEHGRAAMPCIAGATGEGGTKCHFITLEYTHICPEFLIQFVQTDDDQRREKDWKSLTHRARNLFVSITAGERVEPARPRFALCSCQSIRDVYHVTEG